MPSRVRSIQFPAGFPLRTQRVRGATGEQQAKDPLTRLLMIHAGSATVVHGRRTWPVKRGGIILVPAALPHQLSGDDDLDWTMIRFDAKEAGIPDWDIAQTTEFARIFPSLARRGVKAPAIGMVHLIPRHMDQATALEGEIERELVERRPGWRDLAMGHFQHLLILISRFADKEPRISSDAMKRIAAAIRQIESCYNSHLSLPEVAKSCGMSERTFYRVFRQATGETPNGCLKRLRIEHAAEMLRASDDTVTEIAYAVGFSDSNFFTREFHRAYGHAPTDYRRRWQA